MQTLSLYSACPRLPEVEYHIVAACGLGFIHANECKNPSVNLQQLAVISRPRGDGRGYRALHVPAHMNVQIYQRENV